MRGIGHAFSRLPAARAMIAGVALLAGMSAQRAMAQTSNGMDDTALAVPRVSPRGLSGVAFPQPLPLSPAAEDNSGSGAIPVPEESEPSGRSLNRRAALDLAVRNAARSGAAGAASRLIDRTHGLPALYSAQLMGEAAQILFTLNRDQEAYDLAAGGAACG